MPKSPRKLILKIAGVKYLSNKEMVIICNVAFQKIRLY